MIAKDSTTVVNFYAMNADGSPATGKTITATISINGTTATAITDTISEIGSGWYKFNHTFSSEGNAFIQFSCTGCVIPPWEDNVVDITTTPPPTATEVAYAVWEENVNRHTSSTSAPLYYLKFYIDRIPQNVWGYSGDRRVYLEQTAISSIWNNSQRTLTSSFPTARDIWNYGSRILTSPVTYNDTDGIIFLATADNVATAVSDLETYGDSHWLTATGFSTFNPSTDDVNISSISISSIQSGLATSSDITTSEAAIIVAMPDISGLSTFDASTDTVLIDATQAATMVTATGFATANDVSNAETAIISAFPTIPTDYAKAGDMMTLSSTDINSIRNGLATETDITNAQTAVIDAMPDVSGLSTFDSTTDSVLINATQADTMRTATGFATPSDIPSASDVADAVWDTDLTDITASDTAAKQIYTALSNCATSTDAAVLRAELDEILGGVLHWRVTLNTLTVYGPNNNAIRTYTITRDENGNILQLTPNG